MVKWIAAFIGFEFARFPGAILGFIIGTIIDNYISRNKNARTQYRTGSSFNPFGAQYQPVSPGKFEVNLLYLSAIIIKADGAISQSELDYVRVYFVKQFGRERANATFRKFNEVRNQKLDPAQICQFLRPRTSYEMRLQILHFLFGIANADGKIAQAELNALNRIAQYLSINNHDFGSIKAMFFKSADEAYKILEVDKNASDSEIKKAYRTMVKKYHPDRLNGMDEAYIKGAREKFNKVKEAYDKIRKERGF